MDITWTKHGHYMDNSILDKCRISKYYIEYRYKDNLYKEDRYERYR